MSAKIEINGIPATIEAGEWECADAALLEQLRQFDSPSYFPDGVNARQAIAKIGGTLIEESPAEDVDDEQIIH